MGSKKIILKVALAFLGLSASFACTVFFNSNMVLAMDNECLYKNEIDCLKKDNEYVLSEFKRGLDYLKKWVNVNYLKKRVNVNDEEESGKFLLDAITCLKRVNCYFRLLFSSYESKCDKGIIDEKLIIEILAGKGLYLSCSEELFKQAYPEDGGRPNLVFEELPKEVIRLIVEFVGFTSNFDDMCKSVCVNLNDDEEAIFFRLKSVCLKDLLSAVDGIVYKFKSFLENVMKYGYSGDMCDKALEDLEQVNKFFKDFPLVGKNLEQSEKSRRIYFKCASNLIGLTFSGYGNVSFDFQKMSCKMLEYIKEFVDFSKELVKGKRTKVISLTEEEDNVVDVFHKRGYLKKLEDLILFKSCNAKESCGQELPAPVVLEDSIITEQRLKDAFSLLDMLVGNQKLSDLSENFFIKKLSEEPINKEDLKRIFEDSAVENLKLVNDYFRRKINKGKHLYSLEDMVGIKRTYVSFCTDFERFMSRNKEQNNGDLKRYLSNFSKDILSELKNFIDSGRDIFASYPSAKLLDVRKKICELILL